MAKLRSNHQKTKTPFSGLSLRVFAMLGLIGFMFVVFMRLNGDEESDEVESFEEVEVSSEAEDFIPLGALVEEIEHRYYTLGYVEPYEQAAWVAYKLTKKSLQIPNVPRAKRFEEDKAVSTGSASYYDYRGSGYSRGHLAPAGDMAFSTLAMEESFFMSNMSPQKIPFNGGIWRELEESVRDWAYKNDELYIVTGPVLNTITKYIGKESKVGVPKLYYKVILDIKGDSKKAIGFIMKNEVSAAPIMEFAKTLDEVEDITGLDFFSNLLTEELENKLESNIDIKLWPISIKRQENRINNWNKNK